MHRERELELVDSHEQCSKGINGKLTRYGHACAKCGVSLTRSARGQPRTLARDPLRAGADPPLRADSLFCSTGNT